ncbi:MAG: MBL fold metallo-hydrolase [Candidatus Sabulitectum sp.]|nr:MBL fold metallo-hydrolase [Candidatus Sabulitectum sp.]
MRITIVYDNTAKAGLIPDWGWSCFVETEERNILFDTGGNGRILMKNLKNLSIKPESVNDVVISHPDFDHIGGLSAFLNSNEKADVYIPSSFRGIRYPNAVHYCDEPQEIYHGVYLTGELGKREQSMAVNTERGLVLVIGCGHPGVESIMNSVSPFGEIYGVVGGLHDFNNFDILENTGIICPAHCTKYKEQIMQLYADKCVEGGVGRVIEI